MQPEREIQGLMADFGISRYVALGILGMLPGEALGDGDLFRIRPHTDDERRRLGLGPDPDEDFVEPRSRREQAGLHAPRTYHDLHRAKTGDE